MDAASGGRVQALGNEIPGKSRKDGTRTVHKSYGGVLPDARRLSLLGSYNLYRPGQHPIINPNILNLDTPKIPRPFPCIS